MNELLNFLIVRTDRVGDVVLTIPMIPMIKRQFPNSKIFIMVRKYTIELLEYNKDVEQLIVYDENENFFMQLRRIKEKNFKYVFVVSPAFRTSLLFFLSCVPFRIGTGYRLYSILFNKRVFQHRKYSEKHEVEFNLDLLKAININTDGKREFNIPIINSDVEKVEKMLESFGITEHNKIVIIHPGSGKSSLDLPEKKYIDLINLISLNKNIRIILTGGKGEESLIDRIKGEIRNPLFSIVNKLNLRELAHLIKRSILFISNSTGPIHIAAAVGSTVVGFYSPVITCSEKRWGPYTDKKYIFTPELPKCRRCTLAKCKYYNCMDKIPINDVYEKINHLLK